MAALDPRIMSEGMRGFPVSNIAVRVALSERRFDALPAPAPRFRAAGYVFMESKKSLFVFVWRSLSSRNSMPSIGPIGLRMRRRTYILRS